MFKGYDESSGSAGIVDRSNESVPKINRLLRALLSDSGIELRKYKSFPRLLKSVLLDFAEFYVLVKFHSGPDAMEGRRNTSLAELFTLNEHLVLYPLFEELKTCVISDVFSNELIVSNILTQVLPASKEIVYDVGDIRSSRPDLGVFGVDEDLRSQVHCRLHEYSLGIRFTTTGRSHALEHDSEHLHSWPWLMDSSPTYSVAWQSNIPSRPRGPDLVILRFETDQTATLSDVHFNATSLLNMTKEYAAATRIRTELAGPSNGITAEQNFVTTLQDIRNSVIACIGSLLKRTSTTLQGPAPKFWMDGEGQVRVIEFESHRMTRSEGTRHSQAAIANKIEKVRKLFSNKAVPESRGSVGRLLLDLFGICSSPGSTSGSASQAFPFEQSS